MARFRASLPAQRPCEVVIFSLCPMFAFVSGSASSGPGSRAAWSLLSGGLDSSRDFPSSIPDRFALRALPLLSRARSSSCCAAPLDPLLHRALPRPPAVLRRSIRQMAWCECASHLSADVHAAAAAVCCTPRRIFSLSPPAWTVSKRHKVVYTKKARKRDA